MHRSLLALLAFCIITPGLGVPSILVSWLRPESNISMRVGRVWSRALLWAVGARVHYEGPAPPAPFPCIYMSNHQSNADIWALICVLPLATRFVAKQSLFRVPFLGGVLRSAGFIAIDRSNRARAIRSLRLAAAKVRGGRPVVVFPEGTRSRDGRLAPFKKGPFHLALEAGVPVVPVAISGSGKVLRPGAAIPRPGPVRVRFMAPIDVAAYGRDAQGTLSAEVRRAIASGLEPDELQASDSAQ